MLHDISIFPYRVTDCMPREQRRTLKREDPPEGGGGRPGELDGVAITAVGRTTPLFRF